MDKPVACVHTKRADKRVDLSELPCVSRGEERRKLVLSEIEGNLGIEARADQRGKLFSQHSFTIHIRLSNVWQFAALNLEMEVVRDKLEGRFLCMPASAGGGVGLRRSAGIHPFPLSLSLHRVRKKCFCVVARIYFPL